ncbi:uncharacterized protein H6S33_007028 [Morchella sextelata]|uniref:uncharacterized protein n=1 Tax=Morchella sextelata TaxID=1174677 RepID=UPI001D03B4B5|nr:uncharacterized protein H6S33_007028 [Morchella sextelata]KAH0603997.1 hypothetical protein H6S33_007028 [Morchella sextelata]
MVFFILTVKLILPILSNSAIPDAKAMCDIVPAADCPGTFEKVELHDLSYPFGSEAHFEFLLLLDKGKSDLIAKLLVCIQAVWLGVQSTARLGVGLPVTLLEIHILMHVPCTLVMYACWMKKPLDVAEQVAVTTDIELASLISVNYAKLHLSSKLHIEYASLPAHHTDPVPPEVDDGGEQTERSAEPQASSINSESERIPQSSSPAIPDTNFIFIPEERSVFSLGGTPNTHDILPRGSIIFHRGSVEPSGASVTPHIQVAQ